MTAPAAPQALAQNLPAHARFSHTTRQGTERFLKVPVAFAQKVLSAEKDVRTKLLFWLMAHNKDLYRCPASAEYKPYDGVWVESWVELAEELDCSQDSARKQVRILEASGLIHITPCQRFGGRNGKVLSMAPLPEKSAIWWPRFEAEDLPQPEAKPESGSGRTGTRFRSNRNQIPVEPEPRSGFCPPKPPNTTTYTRAPAPAKILQSNKKQQTTSAAAAAVEPSAAGSSAPTPAKRPGPPPTPDLGSDTSHEKTSEQVLDLQFFYGMWRELFSEHKPPNRSSLQGYSQIVLLTTLALFAERTWQEGKPRGKRIGNYAGLFMYLLRSDAAEDLPQRLWTLEELRKIAFQGYYPEKIEEWPRLDEPETPIPEASRPPSPPPNPWRALGLAFVVRFLSEISHDDPEDPKGREFWALDVGGPIFCAGINFDYDDPGVNKRTVVGALEYLLEHPDDREIGLFYRTICDAMLKYLGPPPDDVSPA